MPTIKITKRAVEALAAQEKLIIFWDQDLSGFGVKVTPAGGKTYIVQYRMGGRGSATRRYTIGPDGTWTATLARAEAERLLRMAASGVDPQAAAKEREHAERELAFGPYSERFLADYGKRNWRQRTYTSAESNMRRWVIPFLSRKALPAITKRDLIELLDRVPATNPALPRNLFALLRKLFNWATERGDLERSPMDTMKPPAPVGARDRVLKDEELVVVAACAEAVGDVFGAMIRLLIVTGQRREEVAGMTWGELDRRLMEWSIPAARAKNGVPSTVPLSDIARGELDGLAGSTRWPRAGYVLTTNGKTSISGFSKVKLRLDKIIGRVLKREIDPWRFHDLRRTFATNMQRLGVRFEVTEALLNHSSGARSGVAGVYQRHVWKEEKKEAIRLWNDRLRTMIFEWESSER
ncbi:tyrosine-type recombinase/integrase [Sphingomonas sp. CROZ-RG-20F-R02-07]|uniref:tyrosine-type recombinase/integrase n=1 Tax=Sphingomonas sp. CROZ-RG-20F-R02-07 TaxID=2914832 RepID=UPI001F59DB95|nr:tyrosine-type recombinase/integrase [Sphingomonas sp. CROZ-RG-20F-R02-07]